MRVITYQVALLEPMLVTTLGGEPNGAFAFDYLPGSVLRGALIASYLRERRSRQPDYQLDASEAEVRRLFFDGTTRYLNGYLVHNGKRTLPAPVSWHQKKGDEKGPLSDFALTPSGKETWKALGPRDFVLLRKETVQKVRPNRQITVHTARNRRLGRPQDRGRLGAGSNEDPGAVYRYEALAAEQTFEAAIVCDHDEDAAIHLSLLNQEATLGGSRSGGYGHAVFQNALDQDGLDWCEIGEEAEDRVSRQWVLTLLSDALLRDENGQFTADPEVVRQAIQARAGVDRLDLHQVFIRSRVVGGFNRKWGLPLPQTLAVGMGSVFVFSVDDDRVEALGRLESEGIGERRAEGFGRVVVNWQRSKTLAWTESCSSTTSKSLRLENDSPGGEMAGRMVQRMLRSRLDGQVMARAHLLGQKIRGPSKSQLGRLRSILHDALQQAPDQGRARLLRFMDDLSRRASARKQFSGDRPAGMPLLDWLRSHISDESRQIERELDIRSLPDIGGIRALLTPELIYEYNLRLIDAVLARAAKNKRKETR